MVRSEHVRSSPKPSTVGVVPRFGYEVAAGPPSVLDRVWSRRIFCPGCASQLDACHTSALLTEIEKDCRDSPLIPRVPEGVAGDSQEGRAPIFFGFVGSSNVM